MTGFRVRPKPASIDTLRAMFRSQVVDLPDGSVVIPKHLGRLEERDLTPRVTSLRDKAWQCVQQDRRCDRIAKARRA